MRGLDPRNLIVRLGDEASCDAIGLRCRRCHRGHATLMGRRLGLGKSVL